MEGLMFSSDNPLDFQRMIVSVSVVGISKILEIGFMDDFMIHRYQSPLDNQSESYLYH